MPLKLPYIERLCFALSGVPGLLSQSLRALTLAALTVAGQAQVPHPVHVQALPAGKSSISTTNDLERADVLMAFFDFQGALNSEIDRRKLTNVTGALSFEKSAQALLGLTPQDFESLTRSARVTNGKLRDMSQQQRHLLEEGETAHSRENAPRIQQLQANKRAIVLSAMAQLQTALSLDGKKTIEKYVNEEFSKTLMSWR